MILTSKYINLMNNKIDLIYDLSMVNTHGPLLYDRFSKEYLIKNFNKKKKY